jgi:hypothetical protein
MVAKDEEEWLRKFYEGSFLIPGWKSRMKELLRAVPDSEKDQMQALLSDLGEKIGREWAKDNRTRRIDNQMLQKWGDTLSTAKRKGPEVLTREIRKLETEVDNILGPA